MSAELPVSALGPLDLLEGGLLLVVEDVHRIDPASQNVLRHLRAECETAPLLIAVGITTGVNFNPFDGRMATLPVFAYYSYAAPGVPREPFLDAHAVTSIRCCRVRSPRWVWDFTAPSLMASS